MQYFQDHYSQLQHLQMLIHVKALPALLFCTRGRRLSTLTQIYNTAARVCLFWRGQSRSSNPHQVNHQPSVWRGSELLTLCGCVCLLNVWLAGSGVGVVRTLEATAWRTTLDPTHLPRCIHTPSVRTDDESCFALKCFNRAAGWSSISQKNRQSGYIQSANEKQVSRKQTNSMETTLSYSYRG